MKRPCGRFRVDSAAVSIGIGDRTARGHLSERISVGGGAANADELSQSSGCSSRTQMPVSINPSPKQHWGPGGGGVVLTPFGKLLIAGYRRWRRVLSRLRGLASRIQPAANAAPAKDSEGKACRSCGIDRAGRRHAKVNVPPPLDAGIWNCLAISESKYPKAAVVPSAEVQVDI